MKNIIIILISITVLSACSEEVDLTLPEPTDRLVVEGRLEARVDGGGTDQILRLTSIGNYFNTNPADGITDAIVTLTDGNGETFDYIQQENQNGTYLLNDFIAEVGNTYTLDIFWNDSHYQAKETIVECPPLDRVYQVFEEENTFEDGGLKLAIDFTDPSGRPNYYFWELFVDGENILRVDPGNSGNVIAKDDLFDGQQIRGYLPNEERIFEPGEEVLVKQIGLSAQAFDFYLQIFQQTGQTGAFIDVPPAMINGNIVNLTNKENYALGFFSASQIDTQQYTIQEDVAR